MQNPPAIHAIDAVEVPRQPTLAKLLAAILHYLSLLAVRWPRATLIVSLALWLVYGWLIGNHLLSVLAR
ncbi:MAG: hypothetical protein IT320_15380 [Anaerolineae bacterium]|nr:hypothetical protein [Anaerolineae bacterium]